MEHNKPLLSLCIPTYNRAKFLNELIKKIGSQIQELENPELIEFIVSDNCSTDDTPGVVKHHIDNGVDIRYIRNERNLGMDGNFVSCFKKASGSYIWLLGDDDYLVEDAICTIISILKTGEYGLIHLNQTINDGSIKNYSDTSSFFADVSYWITFISANIVNSRFVPEIDFDKYMGTYFTLIPLYMTSAIKMNNNVMIYRQIFDGGKDSSNNGGYNLFEVFVVNFLNIWKEQTETLCDSKKLYKRIKAILYKNFLVNYILTLLLSKNTTRFKTDGAWRILWKYYGKEPYAYYYFVIGMAKFCCKKIIKLLK